MAKKQPNPKRKGPTGAKKQPKPRATSTKDAKNNETQNGTETGLAKIGGDSPTFTTLKKKTAMLKALKISMAIVAPACEMVGIARSTHYDWMNDDPGYKAEVEALIERTFDFVETKMVERINAGSDTMLIWYSKTKMKQRGFIERTEIEVSDKAAFVVKADQKGIRKTMDVIHKKTGTNDKT